LYKIRKTKLRFILSEGILKSLFLFLLTIFTSISVFAQDYNCKIFHSNGSQYLLKIKTVHELGLIDSADNYLACKNIDSLIISSKLLLEEILSIQKAEYSINSNDDFVITFDKSIYKSNDLVSGLTDLQTMVSLNSISFNYLSLQLEYKFSNLLFLCQRVIATGGNSFSEPNYYSLNFGYGVGIEMPVNEFDLLFWFNCTLSTLYSYSDDNGYTLEDMTQFFISMIYQLNLNNSGSIQLAIGLNYYANQFVVEDKKQQLSIQAGLNFEQ
jgi:hypothetical protein